MSKKYMVQYERDGCIGAGSCIAASSDDWSMNDDGKADLLNGQQEEQTGFWVREIDESQLEALKASAQSCPVNIIHIVEKDTGKKVI